MVHEQLIDPLPLSSPDGDDYTWEPKLEPDVKPWPEKVDAELSALQQKVATLERLVHRLLNPALLTLVVLALLMPLPVQAHQRTCHRIPHGTVCVAPGERRTTCQQGYRPWGTASGYICIPGTGK